MTHRTDTATVSRPSRRSWRSIAAAVASVVLVGGMAQSLPVASAAEPTSSRASGVEIIDIDGGTLLAPTPVSAWTGGDDVVGRSDSTGDVLLLNTTQTTGIDTVAGPSGASTTVESAELTLRDRVPVSLTGMSVRCSPDGTSELSFTSLTVDGTDITAEATATPGYSYALPDSIYGSTRLIVGERTTDAAGVVTVTGLRVEAEAGASEIWRVRLGQVSCAPGDLPAPDPTDEPTDDGDPEVPTDPSVPPDPDADATTVTGVRVVAQDGTVLVDDQPQVTTGSQAVDEVVAAGGYPTRASEVSVAALPDGGASVSVGDFTQVPDAGVDPVAEFRWGALRVYGLELDVAADGTSQVSFENTGSAVFVNGVWINVGTDLYTGVDADGEPRVLVHLNERVTNPDGSTTIHGLRYEDLTGTYPDVTLATVVLPAPPAAEVGVSAVTGVRVVGADGAVLVDDQPTVTAAGDVASLEEVVAVGGYPTRASEVSVAALPDGGASVSVGDFTQVPDAGVDPVAEFRWGALRVYGLELDVAADGTSQVSFENTGSAVFVNGVWINVGTDLYTGVDADGEPRVLVHLNERVTNPDGSTTVTALRYEDLTETYPDVSLGIVTLVAAEPGTGEPEPVDPDPGTDEPVLPRWHAFGVQATGPSALSASPLASASAGQAAAALVSDGLTGQVGVRDSTASVTSTGAEAFTGSVELYPQTRAAVSLAGLRVTVTPDGAVVTSDGGVVLGQPVAAGVIEPGTVVELDGTGVRVVLNEQSVDGADTTVTGLRLTDTRGMRADVQVAVVTTLAPTVVPTDPTDPVAPGVPGSGLNPGALVPDGTSPDGTSGGAPLGGGAAQAGAPLASTGAQVRDGLVLAAGLLVVGAAGVAAARRRRVRRDTTV